MPALLLDSGLPVTESLLIVLLTAVTLRDYIAFRFAAAPWVPATPRLDALAAQAQARPSFAATLPREMPKA